MLLFGVPMDGFSISATTSIILACFDLGPCSSIWASERQSKYVLAIVANMPGQRNATLAIALGFRLYFRGPPPYSLKARWAPTVSLPVMYALLVARMMVKARAEASVKRQASTEQMRHASFTAGDSVRSGQKRSKKKAEPKMVAT